jgi:hypothetical protein
VIQSRLATQLIDQGKLRLISSHGETTNATAQVVGVQLDPDAAPSLDELMHLVHELDIEGGRAETPLRFVLGDLVSSIEALPGVTKRDIVNAAFSAFGRTQGADAYNRLRKLSHVARAYPAEATFADGSPRRRLDVAWCVLQELAPVWVPDDFRQQMLQAAACGKMTVKTIRQRLEPFRDRPVARNVASAPERIVQTTVEAEATPNDMRTAAATPTVAPWVTEYDRLVKVPAPIPGYHISPPIRRLLTAVHARAGAAQVVNLLLAGDSGHGKTSLARQFAAETGRPLFIFNCGSVHQQSEWWGVREAADGRTYFRPSPLFHALTLGGAVVVFDEINRIPAHLLNPLLPLLDDRRETVIPSGQHVRIAPGTILVGTANIGDGYLGTFQMDAALKDRLKGSVVTLPAPPPEVMRAALIARTDCAAWQAELLMKIAVRVNAAHLPLKIGLRSLLEAAEWMKVGIEVRQACEIAILNGAVLEESSCRATIENIIDGLIKPDLATVKGLINTVARLAAA